MEMEDNKICKLKSCGGCFNLRTGCIIIASIGIVLAIPAFYGLWLYLPYIMSFICRVFGIIIDHDEQAFLIINRSLSTAWIGYQMLMWITLLTGAVKRNETLVKISLWYDINIT